MEISLGRGNSKGEGDPEAGRGLTCSRDGEKGRSVNRAERVRGRQADESRSGSVVLTLAAYESDLKVFKNFPSVKPHPPETMI